MLGEKKTFVIGGSSGCMGMPGQLGQVIQPPFPYMQPTIIMPQFPWEPMRILPPTPPPPPVPPMVIPPVQPMMNIMPAPNWQGPISPCGNQFGMMPQMPIGPSGPAGPSGFQF